MSKKIKLVIGSTRQGRAGKPIADWLVAQAKQADIELEVLDLKEVALPFFDAQAPPAYMPTQTPEGMAWQAMVGEAEGFVFLTPIYNMSIPAPLKNAIDFLSAEWNGKPAAIVSYGYNAGGANAAKHLEEILQEVKISVVDQKTAIQFSSETFDQSTGQFVDIENSLAGSKESFLAALQAVNEA
jgi:NAD(P)H-dependent FMN reductase